MKIFTDEARKLLESVRIPCYVRCRIAWTGKLDGRAGDWVEVWCRVHSCSDDEPIGDTQVFLVSSGDYILIGGLYTGLEVEDLGESHEKEA